LVQSRVTIIFFFGGDKKPLNLCLVQNFHFFVFGFRRGCNGSGVSLKDAKHDVVCSFEPEPDDDAMGCFWIANLLTRIDFEELSIPFNYDLSFEMDEQVFLPNGEIVKTPKEHIVQWPSQEAAAFITPERPRQRKPYEIFGLTDEEASRLS
jgi:hypothetical protein